MENLTNKDYLEMYQWLYLIRRTEDHMMEINAHTPIQELPHAGIGQEAIAVGTCYGLHKEDQILPTHRTRGAFIMKGISSRTMMAGAFARDVFPCHGKNTSHHIGDVTCGVVAGTGILAGHLPVSLGIAMTAKLKKKDYVTVAYVGDGACNLGHVHETLNFAAAFALPLVIIIENNQYAMSMPITKSTNIVNLSGRAAAYGIEGVTIDGNDVLKVYETAQEAYKRARAGGGPTLIECMTYRWRGHSEKDTRDLRSKDEIEEWKKKCPLKAFREKMLVNGWATDAELKEAEAQAEAEVVDAVSFAEKAPYPATDTLETNVYEEVK